MELTKSEKLKEFAETGDTPKMKEVPPQYDPTKLYTWDPTAQFVYSGQEQATLINALRLILSSEQGKLILAAERAHYAAESALARGLELGIVREKPEPKK